MLLIFPPLAKACEPPAGITRIKGFLNGNNENCSLWDANLEAQLYLLERAQSPSDTWSKRAWKNLQRNLTALKMPSLYSNSDRYERAVRDVNRVLSQSCAGTNTTINLADYQDAKLSPHQSADLILSAKEYRDTIFFPFYQTQLPVRLENYNEEWIGISLNYLSQALPAFALAGYIKEKYPEFKIVIGGGLITSWLRSPGWINPFAKLFDKMIAGQGEIPLLKILTKETTPEPKYYSPDYTNLPLDRYMAPGLILPYSASTGCYWNRCSFCPEKAEGSPYSKLSSDQCMDDLQNLVKKFEPNLIHLLDNAVAPSLMRRMIENPLGVDWYGFARVTPELGDPVFCENLRKSGCVMLKLGIESGSQKVLDAMDKGINLDLVEKSLQVLYKAGIATYVYLLFGTPAESITEARKTLEFTVRNAKAITFLNRAVFNLPRNSSETDTLTIKDFSSGDLGLYFDFHHPRKWDRKAVRHFLATEFKTDPAIRPILQRDPPFFTSNHAPLVLSAIKQNRN